MPPLAIALLVILALALAALLAGEARRSFRTSAIAKPVASLAFLALPFALGGPAGVAGWLVLAGLALSFVGDLCLIPGSQPVFRVGIVAFLLAHVAYGASFVLRGVAVAPLVGALVMLTVAAVLLGRWFVPRVPRALKPAVLAYILVISLMVAFAASAWGAGAPGWIALAALSFYASDIAVARHRFIQEEPANRLVGLPLYYLAQVAFALAATLP